MGAERERIQTVTDNFKQCVEAFEQAKPFSGPSLHFYSRAARIAVNTPFDDLATTDEFLEAAYAALTAWGMHRMGPGNTKLPPYPRFRQAVGDILSTVPKALPPTIRRVSAAEAQMLADALSPALDVPGLTRGQLPFVANSKLLHFALPHLVPPMDRTYTLRFFIGATTTSKKASTLFRFIFPHCVSMARLNDAFIAQRVRRGGYMCDGDAKLIDNAIVGYQRMRADGQSLEGKGVLRAVVNGLPWPPIDSDAGPPFQEVEPPFDEEFEVIDSSETIEDDELYGGQTEGAYYDPDKDSWVEPEDDDPWRQPW